MPRSVTVFFIFCLLLASCNQSQKEANESGESIGADSISGGTHAEYAVHSRQPRIAITDDKSVYIGSVFLLGEDEAYTPLYYRDDIDESAYLNHETAPVDSLITQNDDISRRRLPLAIAEKYFNLSGYQQISVYDYDGYVCDATFVRVELFEDLIESQFIAVFKLLAPRRNMMYPSHCISASARDQYKITPLLAHNIEGETPTQKILEKLGIETDVYNDSHIQLTSDNTIFSGISFLEKGVLLIETVGENPKILMEVKEDQSITDIMPVGLQVNGKPVLVLHMGENETDMMWTSLAVFNGTQYEIAEGSRLQRQ